ncbi:hypothetical protein K525DRAFT_257240, partial [Schizophyllum commune Loenen D]
IRVAFRGTIAHSTIMHPIIETKNGCKLLILVLCASAPVIRGRTALPACPKPAIHPMDGVISHAGRIRAAWFIAIG